MAQLAQVNMLCVLVHALYWGGGVTMELHVGGGVTMELLLSGKDHLVHV